MKKILVVLFCTFALMGLCSCEGGLFSKPVPTPVPDIDPAALITVDDVAANAGYTPVIEPAETRREGNVAEVLYRSEPIGQHDMVKVKLTQFNDTVDYQQIFNQYEQEKTARPSAQLLDGIGQETYVAFPSIHVYDRGCLIDITAGSGAGEEQLNLLKNLAITAAGRLEEIIPDRTNGGD